VTRARNRARRNDAGVDDDVLVLVLVLVHRAVDAGGDVEEAGATRERTEARGVGTGDGVGERRARRGGGDVRARVGGVRWGGGGDEATDKRRATTDGRG